MPINNDNPLNHILFLRNTFYIRNYTHFSIRNPVYKKLALKFRNESLLFSCKGRFIIYGLGAGNNRGRAKFVDAKRGCDKFLTTPEGVGNFLSFPKGGGRNFLDFVNFFPNIIKIHFFFVFEAFWTQNFIGLRGAKKI